MYSISTTIISLFLIYTNHIVRQVLNTFAHRYSCIKEEENYLHYLKDILFYIVLEHTMITLSLQHTRFTLSSSLFINCCALVCRGFLLRFFGIRTNDLTAQIIVILLDIHISYLYIDSNTKYILTIFLSINNIIVWKIILMYSIIVAIAVKVRLGHH